MTMQTRVEQTGNGHNRPAVMFEWPRLNLYFSPAVLTHFPQKTEPVLSRGSRKKKRAVVMMVTVVALFAACWAPFHVVHMMVEYSKYIALFLDGSVHFLLE